jgi:hypothetical protein
MRLNLETLHTHSVQQAVRQVRQERIKKQEESVSNKHHVQLAKIECHVINDR